MSVEQNTFEGTNESLDSFEVNMKQIEQTNKLLNNIETKLNDFFHKGDKNGPSQSMTFEHRAEKGSPNKENIPVGKRSNA